MAQTRTTNEQMIIDIIGAWTPTDNPELMKSGFNYVADLIPVESELWSHDNLQYTSDLTHVFNISHTATKIIRVIRTDNSIERVCTEVSYNNFKRGKDSTSIFYNSNNIKSPIWTMTPRGKIEVSPDTTVGASPSITVYYWTYEYNDYFGTSDGGDVFDAMHITEDIFFPREAHLLAIIKAASNILQVKIGTAVHDDEDSELLGLLQTQMAILDRWFIAEAERLRLPYKEIGVEENDIK